MSLKKTDNKNYKSPFPIEYESLKYAQQNAYNSLGCLRDVVKESIKEQERVRGSLMRATLDFIKRYEPESTRFYTDVEALFNHYKG